MAEFNECSREYRCERVTPVGTFAVRAELIRDYGGCVIESRESEFAYTDEGTGLGVRLAAGKRYRVTIEELPDEPPKESDDVADKTKPMNVRELQVGSSIDDIRRWQLELFDAFLQFPRLLGPTGVKAVQANRTFWATKATDQSLTDLGNLLQQG